MKSAVIGLSAFVLVLVSAFGVEEFRLRTTISVQNGQINALVAEIRPLRTSEGLMLSLAEQVKEWKNVARPIVVDACTPYYGGDFCRNEALLIDPAALRTSLVTLRVLLPRR